MARTLEQIQNEIFTKIKQEPALSELTSTSKVALWRLWVYVVSFAIWAHEQLVETNARNSRIHTLRWYRAQALAFLDGLDLIWENGQFSYPKTDDLAKRQLVKRCAVLENNDGELVIKITGKNNQPLADDKAFRFSAYMNEIKDAGNRLKIINREADELKLELTVYADALQLDLDSGQLLAVEEMFVPVENSIERYLQNLEFNGALIKNRLIDAVQNAQGVDDVELVTLQHRYGNIPFGDVGRLVIPDAGHFKITDLKITYKSTSDVANDSL